jgi:hypothetical protein
MTDEGAVRLLPLLAGSAGRLDAPGASLSLFELNWIAFESFRKATGALTPMLRHAPFRCRIAPTAALYLS